MITPVIPRRIRYIPASGIFTAAFNVPTIGSFDFNGQYLELVPNLLPNTVYLIDSFSLSGNVASEDFLNSILSVPSLSVMKTLEKEAIFDRPIQIHNFFTDRQIVRFFKTGHNKTGLAATLTGNLNMIPAFVGLAGISLSINFSLHAIDDSAFEKEFSKNT
jgi:hypothetical protein